MDLVKTEADQYLGMSMTYSLFEFLKEKFEELMQEQPDEPDKNDVEKMCTIEQEPQVMFCHLIFFRTKIH